MKKEEVKIYNYTIQGVKYHTPSVEYAYARAEKFNTDVYYETYWVEVPEEKTK